MSSFLEAQEAEGRRAARAKLDHIRDHGYVMEGGLYPRCDHCGCPVTPHCDGCAACPRESHPWWCRGDLCVCGQSRAKHPQTVFPEVTMWNDSPFVVTGALGGKCRSFRSLEQVRAYEQWCDCTEEEAAERRALGVAILQEFALGLGPGGEVIKKLINRRGEEDE